MGEGTGVRLSQGKALDWESGAIILATLLLAATLTSCHGRGSDTGPFPGAPIILISIDTLRSDHLPAYGYTKVETPAIDALRRDAILFARAYSHCPLTLPSHASLLSGLLPAHTGVRDNAGYTFDAARHPSLPRLLKQAGYETGAAVSTFLLRRATGLSGGFDFFDDEVEPGTAERAGTVSAHRALAWVKGRGSKPFFLFLHLYEPHTPYEPPEPFASRYRSAPYDGEIATADAVVGTVVADLKRRGLYDKAIIVLLSDHGEGLGEHGEEQHGVFLYRETLQVPLLLKLPGGARSGTTVATPAALVDVAPTLLALAGVTAQTSPAGLDGQNLLTLPAEPARRIYAETFLPRLHYGWSELASLIEGRLHYIHGPSPELFDIAADPAEQRDVLATERPAAAGLRQALDGYDRTLAPPGAVDAETARKLAALGYAGAPRRTGAGPLPDPRTKRGVLRDIQSARVLAAEEKYGEAAAVLRKVVGEEPGLVDAWAFLGDCLDHPPEDPPAALAAYQKAFELSGGTAELALPVARELHKLGRLDEAKAHAEMAAAADPAAASEVLASIALARGDADTALAMLRRAGRAKEAFRRDLGLLLAQSGRTQDALEVLQPLSSRSAEPATLTVMAHALVGAGRPDEAVALLERALAADARNAEAHELLGTIDLRLRRPAEARVHLEQAVALKGSPSAWSSLGVALYAVEGPEPALRAWQQAVSLDKTQYDALLNIGLVSAKTGRLDQARQALHQFVASAPPEHFALGIEKARQLLQEIGG
jgi:arylsulfatase A-like enzyme/tetratricopeptide (TPR) repeat protein